MPISLLVCVGCGCSGLANDRINARSLRTSILNMTLLSCSLISY